MQHAFRFGSSNPVIGHLRRPWDRMLAHGLISSLGNPAIFHNVIGFRPSFEVSARQILRAPALARNTVLKQLLDLFFRIADLFEDLYG